MLVCKTFTDRWFGSQRSLKLQVGYQQTLSNIACMFDGDMALAQ